ncbi:hypothetical protein DFP72DRAFT_863412 [Ephemerocybe angulata]|uniref:Uncharacterized protein n=1 Tax=Ephemerocybe angulata TaxID=980116 RepID=A0A8H6H7J5_9AGAR|nr:hypothetical protein DFP72DRAFT_863412 [Tulosesus angulatus]
MRRQFPPQDDPTSPTIWRQSVGEARALGDDRVCGWWYLGTEVEEEKGLGDSGSTSIEENRTLKMHVENVKQETTTTVEFPDTERGESFTDCVTIYAYAGPSADNIQSRLQTHRAHRPSVGSRPACLGLCATTVSAEGYAALGVMVGYTVALGKGRWKHERVEDNRRPKMYLENNPTRRTQDSPTDKPSSPTNWASRPAWLGISEGDGVRGWVCCVGHMYRGSWGGERWVTEEVQAKRTPKMNVENVK